jgi:hypothetical protein
MHLTSILKQRTTKDGRSQDINVIVDFSPWPDEPFQIVDIFTFDWNTQAAVSIKDCLLENFETEVYVLLATIDFRKLYCDAIAERSPAWRFASGLVRHTSTHY